MSDKQLEILMKTFLPAPFEIINLTAEESPSNSQRTLVFVGVMTSKDFLDSRAKAVYNTWGKLVPGRIAFFSSEGSTSDGKQNFVIHHSSLQAETHKFHLRDEHERELRPNPHHSHRK